MNEILLNVKSQLIYVLENQLKIKPEFFLKEFGTPDSDDVLDKYYDLISDKIVNILNDNYDFIKNKSNSLLDKLPGSSSLNQDDKDSIQNNMNHFINEELSLILFNKISTTILDWLIKSSLYNNYYIGDWIWIV